ncbi:MAG: c-type cytochrome [Pseudomonadota bacterium]
MNRLAGSLAILIVLPLLALGGIYLGSELRLRDFDEPPAFDPEIPTNAETIERGEHVARIRGCFGCHGQRLEGRVFTEQWPWVERAVAPNLAAHAKKHSATTINAAIRHGVGHDGRALWSMPSYNWKHLSDDDLVALIAYLRSADVVQTRFPQPKLGLRARWQIAVGESEHMADWVGMVPDLQYQDHADRAMRFGEYLAMTMCNECHGLDLRGATNADGPAPDLAILAAYSNEDFRKLMSTGTAIGGRGNLFLMSMIARDRFPALTEEELVSLLTYLRTVPNQPATPNAPWRTPQ